MRCSVSPFARAACVCMLRQLAQPLIWEDRISTRWTRLGSRLEATAMDVAIHFFTRSGAAASRSLAVKRALAAMVRFLLSGFRHHDEPGRARVTLAGRKIGGGGH